MTAAPLDDGQRALIDDVTRLLERARELLPASASAPCFARLRVERAGRLRDYLLGWHTRVGDSVTVLQWSTAPLAAAFFACPVDGDYEIEAEGRTLEGTVRARNLLSFDAQGALCEVTHEGSRLHREGDVWSASPDDAFTLRARDLALRLRPPSAVEVQLDEAQRRAVMTDAGGALLVLGEAGVGKTTVALHRLAHLKSLREGARFDAAVVVPTEGLRRLTSSLVERLGIEGVDVAVYDRWAAKLARKHFPDVPSRESEDAAPGVLHLKRHRALAPVLRDFAAAGKRKGKPRRDDLHELFGDRVWMERVAGAAEGTLAPSAVSAVLEHTRVQYTPTTEQEYADVVDATRLETIDGKAIDEATPMNDAGTVDVEDYAALFELDRLRAELRGARAEHPRRYDALVIDEAQELAPLELKLLGRCVAAGGTLVVAGDAGQQVDATACFEDWPSAMRDLGAERHDVATLTTSYRCPEDVTALARHLLDPTLSPPRREDARNVGFARVANECHLVAGVVDALRELTTVDPRASVAVIARLPETARRLAGLIGRGVDVRLALGGDFRFGPGVNVTAVQEVKGLEFDHVVIPDASEAVYADDPAARRALYVAVTRAIHQVVLASVGPWSPLLAAFAG